MDAGVTSVGPPELQKVKEMLKIAGIDYMELYEAGQSDKGGEYVFTRSYNGAVRTMPPSI